MYPVLVKYWWAAVVIRLHGLVTLVLPQLQQNPGRSFALAAVEAVLFDRCSDVLDTLLRGAPGEDDGRYESTLLELQALRPRHLGVRQAFWLEVEQVRARARARARAAHRAPGLDPSSHLLCSAAVAQQRTRLALLCGSADCRPASPRAWTGAGSPCGATTSAMSCSHE